ncbi:MAG: cysteine desulfurase [Chloroflexota bacterium]|nr:cysteine desulfurase [Chloroflexota bacterium]
MYDLSAVRADFPVLSRQVNGKPLVYLDNAATSQKPRQVIEALVDYYERYNSNVHRGVHTLSVEATDRYEEAREKVARFINAPSAEHLVWVRNTTEAINLVAKTWAAERVGPGDRIVVTEMEHHSNLVPWQQLAKERGAELAIAALGADHKLDEADFERLLTPNTRLAAFTHMSNVLGTITPAKRLAESARRVGAAVLIDAAQSVPHLPIDVQDLDADFVAFSGHKMLAPTGIGCLYARGEALEQMQPFLHGGEMVLEVTYEDASWNYLPMRFEAGTPNIADAIGMGAAVDYLAALGMENVRRHEVELTRYALRRFEELEEAVVYGPADLDYRGGVVSFHMEGLHPHDLGQVLDTEGVAIRTGHHCAMPLVRSRLNVPATARASFYLYNTEEEVDALIEALNKALRYFGRAPRS